jgi:hypothetical protein
MGSGDLMNVFSNCGYPLRTALGASGQFGVPDQSLCIGFDLLVLFAGFHVSDSTTTRAVVFFIFLIWDKRHKLDLGIKLIDSELCF